jgi:hypothetical protein
MKKSVWLIAMNLLICLNVSAQSTFNISGNIIEKETGEAVISATIQLLALPDSSFVEGTVTGEQGDFTFKSIKKGKYAVKVSYIGFITRYVDVDLNTQKSRNANIGYITMASDAILLKATEVTAHASKVAVSGDSLVYNASAYRVPEGSTLEALVKQLPGAKVDSEGNITINGKTVNKILVDGKEFFLNDKEVAMKNIPTEMIEKLKTLGIPVYYDHADIGVKAPFLIIHVSQPSNPAAGRRKLPRDRYARAGSCKALDGSSRHAQHRTSRFL